MLTNPLTTQFVEILNEDHEAAKFGTKPRTGIRNFRIHITPIAVVLIHIIAPYALYATVFKMKILTFMWIIVYTYFAMFGLTGGAHRLWSHKCYKAKLPLQIILLIAFSASGQQRLFRWTQNHRLHHKYSETDADPHNSKRGFFFSHVGWLLQREHPEVTRKRQQLDMKDLTDDPLLKFHDKFFWGFYALFCFIIPSLVPVYLWQETWSCAFVSQSIIRYVIVLNLTFSVNSFAHIWGIRPYDRRIRPVENISVSILTLGEGWHNYHHTFPWDYKAAELGHYTLNLTTMLLDFFAKIGWAYDLKTPSSELVKTVIQKYGDGSHVCEVSEKEFDENYDSKAK